MQLLTHRRISVFVTHQNTLPSYILLLVFPHHGCHASVYSACHASGYWFWWHLHRPYTVKAMIKLNKLYIKLMIMTYLIILCRLINCFLQHHRLRVLWTCWNFEKNHSENKHSVFCYGRTLRVTLNGVWHIRVSDVLNSGQVSLLQTQ